MLFLRTKNYSARHTAFSEWVSYNYWWRAGTKHIETGPKQLTDSDRNELKSIRRKNFDTPWPSLPLSFASSLILLKYQVTGCSCGILKGCMMVVLSKNQTANCLLLFCLGLLLGRGGKWQGMSKNEAWPTG